MTKKNQFQQLFQGKQSEKALFFPSINRFAAVLQNRDPNQILFDPTLLSNGLIQAERLLDLDGFVLEIPLEEMTTPLSNVPSKDWDAAMILESQVIQNFMEVVRRIKVIHSSIPILITFPGPITVIEALNSKSPPSNEIWINDIEIMGEMISEMVGEFVKQQIDAIIIKDSQVKPINDQDIEEILVAFFELTNNIASFYQCKLIYSYSGWVNWLQQIHVQGLALPVQYIVDSRSTELPYTLGCEIDLSQLPPIGLSNFILTKHPVPDHYNPVNFKNWIENVRNK